MKISQWARENFCSYCKNITCMHGLFYKHVVYDCYGVTRLNFEALTERELKFSCKPIGSHSAFLICYSSESFLLTRQVAALFYLAFIDALTQVVLAGI